VKTTSRTLLAILGPAALGLAVLPADASAQFNNQWVTFVNETGTRLAMNPTAVSNNTDSLPGDTPGSQLVGTEVDFGIGDLDKDGWTDLVVVRKQNFTSRGRRTNILLMNENGVLQNRTNQYATASLTPGDQGFNTPTNDRDVQCVDVDGDGWLDVVTCTTLSDNQPKVIGHPRVYMNLGDDVNGNWLGLRHEDARFPQLFSFSTGNPTNPRFCSVAAGDLTGDGRPDLYFGDYDSTGSGGESQPAGFDMNDRLLINDGNGFFTDQSQARMTATALQSAFGMASEIADMNGDGLNDIIKDTALNAPQYVAIQYNTAPNGVFPGSMFNNFHTGSAPYHVAVGDLNNDGRLDMITSDDAADRYRYNTGNDGLGRAVWSSNKFYQFLSGNDDGFGSNCMFADLDNDGWNDTIHTDVDVDIEGCNRRIHIYHNPGGTVGSQITLKEERQSNTGNQGAGWLGVVGMLAGDLRGGHDVAVMDLDNDGDKDMVVSRCTGTFVWMNQLDPMPIVCQTNIGFGGPGNYNYTVCGQALATGNTATLSLTNLPTGSIANLFVSLASNPTPLMGGQLVTIPIVIGPIAIPTGAGTIQFPVSGGNGPLSVYTQWLVADPSLPLGVGFSPAVRLDMLP
jgi:hypothetical protein